MPPRNRRKPKTAGAKEPKLLRLEQRYSAQVVMILRGTFKQVIEKALPLTKPEPETDVNQRFDADLDVLSALFDRFRAGILGINSPIVAQSTIAAKTTAAATNVQNKGHTRQTFRVLPVDPIGAEPWLAPLSRDWVTENVALIRSVNQDMLTDLEKTVYRMVGQDASLSDTKAELVKRFGVSEGRARLIARDQVSKFNGQLTQTRQESLGIQEYVWRDSEDVRVRKKHRLLDGKKFRWDDPPVTNDKGERNHPGEDIQCRCWADPILPSDIAA